MRLGLGLNESETMNGLERQMGTWLNHGDRLHHILGVLDSRIQKFLANHQEQQPCPAVDLASGEGAFPLAYSHHFSSLEWYPTEHQGFSDAQFKEGYVGDLLSHFSWFFAQAASGEQIVPTLFKDSNGDTLNEGDFVKLTGLSNESFNSKYGIVQGVDPADQNRVSVRCIHRSVPMSFKPSNMTRIIFKPRRKNPHDAKTIQGLIDRVRLVDLLDRSTWVNVAELKGRCALVTCTSLLTCLGYREPNIWMDCLELASMLLAPGGYFLQYDTSTYGKFAHARTMRGFVEQKSLGLVLEGRKEEEEVSGRGKMFIMLWRKEPL